MFLLTNKLTTSTGNPHGGLDYFMVNDKLPKASLRTFGMQPASSHASKEVAPYLMIQGGNRM
jgi:hypothetical protein